MKVKINPKYTGFNIELNVDEACDLHSILCDLNSHNLSYRPPDYFSQCDEGEKKLLVSLLNKLDKAIK